MKEALKESHIFPIAVAVAILLGIALYFVGPRGAHGPSAGTPSVLGNVSFTSLSAGAASAVPMRKNYVIENDAEFEELWSLIGAPGERPVVDFSKDVVVAVFQGEKPTGGYGIRVTAVADKDAAREVWVSLAEPEEGCAVTQAVTSPYHVISLPKTSLSFVPKEQLSRGCQ